jgi:glycosyltransferase involved in cell wall biosynthesis
MEKTSVVISAYNEAHNLPALFATLQGVDEILLFDHLSTDDTGKVAKKLGAKVTREGNASVLVTQEDVDTFQRRYGFLPVFTAGNTIMDGALERNRQALQAKNDWILWLDCDERIEWDLKYIQSEVYPVADVIACDFWHTPNIMWQTVKLSRKSKTWWSGQIHGAIIGYDTRIAKIKTMKITHHQEEKPYRATYLPQLEYWFFKTEDTRMNYYLAREYYVYGELEKCLQFFSMYLKVAFHDPEIASAFLMMAEMYWALGKEDEAYSCVFNSMRKDPKAKGAYVLMNRFSTTKDKDIWKKFSDIAPERSHDWYSRYI